MWILIILCTLTLGSTLLVLLPFNRRGTIYNGIAAFWGRLIVVASRTPIEIEGIENIPRVPCVYMSNHQSYFDVISLAGYLPVPIRFVGKKSLSYIPVLGQVLWLTGHVIIDRADRKQAFSELDKAAEKIRSGTNILIFPEGTRSPDHRLGTFKKGGFVLTIKAGVPIVPVSITGTLPMMPKGSFRFNRTRVKIKIGNPIPSSEYTLEQKEKLMERVRRAILENFDENSEEAKANKDEIR
jgi:1-acyl-sn-glycerol-3-phosphate acyltransferase